MIIRELEKTDKKYIDEIAILFHNWWSNKKDIETIKNDLFRDNTITTRILLHNNNLVGVYQILKNDNINTKLTPWFANLYIKEEYRGNNYSYILMKDSDNYAINNNIDILYLHTKHQNFYEKFGYLYIDEIDNKRVFEKHF